MIFQSINPFNGNIFLEHIVLSDKQLDEKLSMSASAYKNWRKTSFEERAEKMNRVASILIEKKDELATLITSEMGKVLAESRAEIEKSAGNCRHYAQYAKKYLADEQLDTPFKSFAVYDPVGAIFAIMPWNFPFWQVLRYSAPAIMAGNVTLLKHAPNTIGCAKAIEKVFLEAGFPEGVFQELTIDIPQVEKVIASDIVQGVTLTGSEFAGSSVAAIAGKHIKKSVLELGGSDAFIVLDDADLAAAAKVATQSRMLNAGQVCISAKRFIVTEKIADEFLEIFSNNIRELIQGNPMLDGVNIGPLARLDLANKLDNQIKKGLDQGAKLIVGGGVEGCNFQPTLLDRVSPENITFREETFGPLATLIRAKNESHAIELANSHRYGLASSIWTKDRERAFKLARHIEAGSVFVNSLVRSDSRIPFGGIKKSGYGRELGGIGIREFMNMKTVVIE
ncbi:NAD-dependent succinate-semialdehyde dehydrogenase [Namhaeicola litoreus]|uniref:NAD-dependent succinate-semialdehyde dehydrogenase n=1 Tax=Namhaeicola litoreus TaxID=1052145 RepID=A0ABW3Y1A7_9FLAO